MKGSGNFNKRVIVKNTEDFQFDSSMIDRKTLKKGTGKRAKVKWEYNGLRVALRLSSY